ncbi:MAG: TlpA disulfide reductase family protein [Nitrospiraceae bacterium]|nr:TlpA disulfide reductase family protein [Nitrospiraceae bacterium]MDA8432468.1 TlpA disulfide reductase family protein [Nitrospiraceae bacterium]
MTKIGTAFVVAAAFLWLTAMAPNSQSGGPYSPKEIDKLDRQKAPDFALKDLRGNTVRLSGLKGKVVLLNFWATWCPPCVAEMPQLNKLYKKLGPRGLHVVAVSTDNSIGYPREFVSKNGIDFTVLYDENRTVTRSYKVFSMPTTFLIDKNGIIIEKFFGDYEWADTDMMKKIEKLL